MHLTGLVALVTGASRNVGLSIATRFAAEGACVVLMDVLPEVEARADDLRKQGYEAIGLVGDVSDRRDADRIVQDTIAHYSRLDILVNNAAVFSSTAILDLADDELEKVYAVNVKGTLHCCQAAVPHMVDQGGGRIVNIGSLAGQRGRTIYGSPGEPTQAAYASSKACIMALTKAMAYEWAPHSIYVNCVSPGNVYTGQYGADQKTILESVIPVGHVGTPDEIAYAVLFLASPEGTYLTGETLNVNGGVLMD